MILILSPKDNLGKITLEGVKTFAIEGPTLLVVFNDGHTRNYPLIHLWYYRSHVDDHKVEDQAQKRLLEKLLDEIKRNPPMTVIHPGETVKPGPVTCDSTGKLPDLDLHTVTSDASDLGQDMSFKQEEAPDPQAHNHIAKQEEGLL